MNQLPQLVENVVTLVKVSTRVNSKNFSCLLDFFMVFALFGQIGGYRGVEVFEHPHFFIKLYEFLIPNRHFLLYFEVRIIRQISLQLIRSIFHLTPGHLLANGYIVIQLF